MQQFQKLNNILGWIAFIIATTVYFLTLEPTASWWDCGEYIATAYKLQVGHPPGAPLFQMLGRFFSLFAFGDTSRVALMINSMSAIASGFTILFLFWSITSLARKIVAPSDDFTTGKALAVVGSGLVGALAYTFSDSFWFSAVEGEVYALSSFFTAVTFWAILKWERVANEPHADRWLLFIVYLIGLSIGVHLLNLLAIPAVVLVYYFKKYTPSVKGIIITAIISLVFIGFIMYALIPEVVSLFAHTEIMFVNNFGLPFNSGTIFFALTILSILALGLYYTEKQNPAKSIQTALLAVLSVLVLLVLSEANSAGNFFFRLIVVTALTVFFYYIRKQKALVNTVLLSLVFLLIGYSSFLMIVIRSNADTPIDENSPEDAVSLLAYLNREQYGSTPLFYGQYYNSPIEDYGDKSPVYEKDKEKGKYVITDDRKGTVPEYHPDFTTIFPRMWSSQKQKHIQAYKRWGKVKGRPIEYRQPNGKTRVINKPTFGENLRFFFRYQIGHMYFRYFMWNFAGRQNYIEGHGSIENGNWKTGINFLDAPRIGDQKNLPESMQNPANNKFYLLPFLFGLIGLFYHIQKRPNDALVVGVLFLMTGLAIVVYLNQYPYQPRERDYAYAGSFYAFAIWIGLSVLFLYNGFRKFIKNTPASAVLSTVIITALVPVIMAVEGWDDHDRSGRYAARDFASNYLKSAEENGIIFTNGDNDTFPLWYAQEVEGVRTDVRVVNFMLASGDWYIHQKFHKMYESEPLPFTLDKEDYVKGTNDAVFVYPQERIQGHQELKSLIRFIKNDDDRTKLPMQDGTKLNFIPTNKVKLTIDKQKVIESGLVPEYMHDRIVDEIKWTINKNYLYKNDLMFLDLIATNNWERAIYFANPSSTSDIFATDDYMHLEGMIYKFMPVKAREYYQGMGGVHARKTYDLLMNEFKWGRLHKPDVTIDRESQKNLMMPKNNFVRTAEALINQNRADSAVNLADEALRIFNPEKIPPDFYLLPLVEVYYEAGAMEKGDELAREIADRYSEDMDYYASLRDEFFSYYEEDLTRAFSAIRRLSMQAEEYGREDLAEELNTLMDDKINYLSGMMQ